MSKIGIDLGSSNSCCAIWDGRAARMIEIGEGVNTILPSVITIADGEIYVGADAVEMGKLHPEHCYRHFKRRVRQLWHDNEDTGPQTCRGDDGDLHYRGPDGFTYSPVELVSYLLASLVTAANQRLQPMDSVTGAVICVPPDFTRAQRDGIVEAAKLAGLDDVELMHEPTAAAIANGFDAKKAKTIVVLDAGGGTVDCTAVRVGNGLIDVLATNGNRALGGEDFDEMLGDTVVNMYRTEHTTDLKVRDAAMVRIMIEAEAVKKRLSEKTETFFRVDDIDRSRDGVTQHINYPISREFFEETTKDLRKLIVNACNALLADLKRQDVNFSIRDIHEVLLVGGMTRVPSIRQIAKEVFGKDPRRDAAPEQVVAMGAAIRAAILDGRKADITIADVLGQAISIETTDGIAAVLVPRGMSIPFSDTFMLSNPDEGQTEISIRLLSGDAARASACQSLWAAEIPIEAGEPETARVPLSVKINASGRATIEVAGQVFEGVG